jgi:hypothetical protein
MFTMHTNTYDNAVSVFRPTVTETEGNETYLETFEKLLNN